ncbi:caspase family protein [Iodobacter sp. HSC-16F04]|uniref:Caspase family protein n=1 Tax=Iodobacter violaceini TaxID=3044271 RepID=A0ABX0KV83_9NEIS|nr:caspase family protein [Iodobacter violacea]NHQ86280.1 caspase family protein [Iodobacter violacea]
MHKKALLIGNSRGLSGVKIDIFKTLNFLKSDVGGSWNDNEIVVLNNPSRNVLLRKTEELRENNLDYFFCMFSGHGAFERNTILEINEKEECITEDNLHGISSRQLNIFDCCRGVLSGIPALEERYIVKASTDNVRLRYERRIMQANPQEVRLYSCSIGESSYDTENGAIYLGNLLNSASQIDGEYKTVSAVHNEARLSTIAATRSYKDAQTPTAVLAKCLSQQELIFSIKP